MLLAVWGVGVIGIHRSLWLDEAWVANSLREPSLHGMFFYPGWLQTTPPLFLLLARGALALTGTSNAAFRAVPLLFSLAAAGWLLAAARGVATPAMAAFATVLVMFDGTAVEYSHTLKQYSAELACSCALLLAAFAYLELPDRKRFLWLLGAVTISLPLAYSSVFLLPGIVLLVAISNWRRAACLAATSAAILLPLYWFLIRGNLAPELRTFWAHGRDPLTASMAAALLFCAACSICILVRFLQRKASLREWQYLLCLLPCLLLAAAAAADLYPVSHRTRLFALPCFVLLAAMSSQDLLERFTSRKLVDALAITLAVGIAAFAVATQLLVPANTYEENFAGAVAYLQAHATPSDLILVHACCIEGFELYSSLDRFTPPHLLFGATGWPCCARGKDARPGESSAVAALDDLDSKVPRGYTGRVWLLYTSRPSHWQYTGLDEGNLWRNHLWDRGCPPGPYLRFANLAISPMNCMAAH